MAADMLYLFKNGYRNFLFFVNSTNIIEKTRDNFLNKQSSKYLFNEKISLNGKEVQVNEVLNFEAIDPEGINILFTTIQGLHSLMTAHRENLLTYEDFKDKKIAIISDEAHHINAWTKNGLKQSEEEAKNTWEQTVTSLFKTNQDNIMLEYTATVDLSDPNIRKKYSSKLIYEYTLKDFRLDGYSKEVKVLQANLKPLDRALQAVIVSQYRRKVADSVKKRLKPVILMKSKTIAESEQFVAEFNEKIKRLKAEDIEKIKTNCISLNLLKSAFRFFDKQQISIFDLVSEIKEEFDDNKCLLLNSNHITPEDQLKVNKLEDSNNEIRVIFAVNMLNEGWDVLNLFDIVRLYDTRDAKANKPGPTTIAEAQLIGRGARYFPFKLDEDQDQYTRKYDDQPESDLRALEELYYHSAHNPKYIQELTVALRETGIIALSPPKAIRISVKDNFKQTDFWKNGLVFCNEKKKHDISFLKTLADIDITKSFKFNIVTGSMRSISIFDSNENKIDKKAFELYRLSQFEKTLWRKAIDRSNFYKFSNLKMFFPALNSINEFIASTAGLIVEVSGTKEAIETLSQDDKLEIAMFVLGKIKEEIEKGYTEYKGTKLFKAIKINEIVKDKTINVVVNEGLNSDQERGIAMREARNSDLQIDLSKENWYIYDENYGTSEEKYLIRFLKTRMKELEEKYSDIYLLRNENLFKLYNFSNGKAIEPDFALFLKYKEKDTLLLYQLFIEPKGGQLLATDKWKEDFLLNIERNYAIEVFLENSQFKIIGLPFYNEDNKISFINEFNLKLKIE